MLWVKAWVFSQWLCESIPQSDRSPSECSAHLLGHSPSDWFHWYRLESYQFPLTITMWQLLARWTATSMTNWNVKVHFHPALYSHSSCLWPEISTPAPFLPSAVSVVGRIWIVTMSAHFNCWSKSFLTSQSQFPACPVSFSPHPYKRLVSTNVMVSEV